MEVRKFFKFLEYTLQGKQFPMEKIQRSETSCISLSSENFTDPADTAELESKRLQDSTVHPGPSNLYY